ncbi:ComEC/Rec2 family competence protein [Sulfurimonas sp. SAG-AH-194-C20]|nr:ComEC/Rec2 family competence protein [Sulfurimonas sp. SAG-AH-194-C20]MDF1878238.1 ComEC/Rec2 family competence protein [Sulfurimonas sp. SAG-AH-194-C20]
MLEKVSLFQTKKDFLNFFILACVLLAISMGMEYYNFKQLTKFDSQLVNATVLKQYTKTKIKKGKLKTYQVLKLKSEDGFTFYTTASKKLQDIKYKHVTLEVWAGKTSFYDYMQSFYSFSKIIEIHTDTSYKTGLNSRINKQHKSKDVSLVYQALFTAKQLPLELQKVFSSLGISHLIAISGFHLSVLSGILFFLIKYPYRYLQKRFFPYRSLRVDSFIIIAISLLIYLVFLDMPPSLLRAFVMLLIGFILYDRGLKIISMQTLFLTLVLVLVIFPRLYFNIGFWLSIAGVFYIFLFLLHFNDRSKVWKFLMLPFWLYFTMLPYSIVIFGNFSIYHPLSIIWTGLFTLFYPIGIFLHLIGSGNLFDSYLGLLMHLETHTVEILIDLKFLFVEVGLSLLAMYHRVFIYALLMYLLGFFIYAINNTI